MLDSARYHSSLILATGVGSYLYQIGDQLLSDLFYILYLRALIKTFLITLFVLYNLFLKGQDKRKFTNPYSVNALSGCWPYDFNLYNLFVPQ